jgi:hypothetical protein
VNRCGGYLRIGETEPLGILTFGKFTISLIKNLDIEGI